MTHLPDVRSLGAREGRAWSRLPLPALVGSLGLALAVAAQASLDRDPAAWFDATLVFAIAAVVWAWAMRRDAPWIDRTPMPVVAGPSMDRNRAAVLLGAIAAVALCAVIWPALSGPTGGGLGALAYPGGPGDARGTLTRPGTFLWLLAIVLYVWALAEPLGRRALVPPRRVSGGRAARVGAIAAGVLILVVVAAAFRTYDLAGLPREMTSDHTEKLMDIRDILAGWRPVFLPGNAGREPLQFYWTALLVRSGMSWSFDTLKFGMVVVSTLTVPLVYWAGLAAAGRRSVAPIVGFASAVVLALMPWHLQVTRQALRIAFAPLFAALALALTYRALSTGRRNDWIALGLVMGAGVYGYTGFRPMLAAVPLVILLRLAHDAWLGRRRGVAPLTRPVLANLVVAAGLAVIVAAPLARYAVDRPDAFWFRTRTRLTDLERPLEHPVPAQLAINVRNALLMFNLTSDSAWFSSPAGRPAMETFGGALLVIGVVTALTRARRGDWRSAGLLAVLPIMLTSSMMALAFPNENPSLGRAAGAIPAVAVLAALPLGELWRWWRRLSWRWGVVGYLVLCTWLFVGMAVGARTRVFTEYRAAYDGGTHPTREGAEVVKAFLRLGGDMDHVYIVGWPFSWDYRAVGILAGHPEWNQVLQGTEPEFGNAVQDAADHVGDPARKLYLVGGERAQVNADALLGFFPGGIHTRHAGHSPGKDFLSVFVPGASTGAIDD